MSDADSKFRVSLVLNIEDVTSGEAAAFSQTSQVWSGLGYKSMQSLQEMLIGEVVAKMLALGHERAAKA
jgi:hypothetical protein